MSGHSHWSKIKRYKGANDAKRGRVWSKLARRIIVAAKSGGGNPDENLSLRYAIDEARIEFMPKDTIENAIKKGTGELAGLVYERAMYEGYGPGGVAILIDCLTDNRNRVAPDLRKIFERAGGRLGTTNSVAYLFVQRGTFTVDASTIEEDALIELALDAGAEDVTREGDVFEITCEATKFHQVSLALKAKGVVTTSGTIAMIPKDTIEVGEDKASQVLNLMEALEDYEDVQNLYANFNIADEVAAKLAKG
jgi:YebC/PmpR family DNA-binding regulatory protein